MRTIAFAPGERLAAFVREFRVVETDQEATRILIPETGLVLGLRYAGAAHQIEEGTATRMPDASIAGMRDSARRMRTSPGGGSIFVTFRDGGAAHFLAGPLHEMFGATVPLDALVPRSEVDRALSRIAGARDHRERVSAFEDFLLARQGPVARDPVVAAAARAIREARGSIRIERIARDLSISRDRLEKRFRSAVGTSPKQLASLVRVRRAIDLHRSGNSLSLVSVEAGYFDQSHFIREFRRYTGESPRRFFGSVEHC